MNSRPLAPFLVSLLLTFSLFSAAVPAARAQNSATADLPAATLRTALLADVAAQLSAHFRADGDLQLESVRPLSLPASTTPLPVEAIEYPAVLASSMIVRIRVGTADPVEHTLVLRAQLSREVWATRAPSVRDASFDPVQLDTRRADVLRERDAIAVTESCADYTFNRAVPANRILTWRDISRRSLVRKGQVIEVAAIDGTLSITMKALAMENGAAGETVKVRNIDSKKEFNALVVADSRAQIRF
ncbi:flagella basal body P-ring formation protein FlgA [Nibricoccus aquaticus]|uniref:Flagella basal body P-ring formation protein FlgA n=1 Tax=Nibricoccus aquaticus TaxID=2576891 RepID=A0A290Q603_9BACT|nr:flagellar basal body P-ring formation chaperone FlgA [Nibricoccus aquaticus]ATC64109.1 flagella basal body P-ring formation protein FlgA [Nibricoccus aquaticus]